MIVYPRSFASPTRMVSFAQNGEDVLIDRVFQKKTGFFIDVGAFAPVDDSVTKTFSGVGWRGINIEPDPVVMNALQQDRPNEINLQCALGRQPGTTTFYRVHKNLGLSTISESHLTQLSAEEKVGVEPIPVPVRTLADVCREFVRGEIDFLKIDAEGSEADIIQGGDWTAFRPRLVLVEAIKLNREWNHEGWEPHLLANGYLYACTDGINRYYLRREDENLLEQLSVPVNALDCYITLWQHQLFQENLALRQQLQGVGFTGFTAGR